MIGVVIPAHNEADTIVACLEGVQIAAAHPALAPRQVQILVVLDACSDGTGERVRALGIETISVRARSVGYARSVGSSHLIARGATWIAHTDADSRVSSHWLAHQVAANADAVCGTVSVYDWHLHPNQLKERYEADYADCDGHRHIHGANLGVSVHAYLLAGGFPPVEEHEDVALVEAMIAKGATVLFSALPRVATSARLANRVRGGFAGLIQSLSQGLAPVSAEEAR